MAFLFLLGIFFFFFFFFFDQLTLLTFFRPAGSGKMKILISLISIYLTELIPQEFRSLRAKKHFKPRLLVLAPNQAGVEVIVRKLKKGITSLRARTIFPDVVYISTSDQVAENIKSFTVNAKLKNQMLIKTNKDRKEVERLISEQQELAEQREAIVHKLTLSNQTGDSALFNADLKSVNEKMDVIRKRLENLQKVQQWGHSPEQIDQLQKNLFLRCQVVCSTVSNSVHTSVISPEQFDAVLIYDSDQCSELETIIPTKFLCSNYVLFGNSFNPPTFGYAGADSVITRESLFQHLRERNPDRSLELTIQYRMHPDIFRFVQNEFIKNDTIRTALNNFQKYRRWWHQAPLTPYRFFEINSPFDSLTKTITFTDLSEAKIALKIFQSFSRKVNKKVGKVAIVSLFKAQVTLLKNIFHTNLGAQASEVFFKTSNEMAGDEYDVIILSPVKSQCDPESKTHITETNLLANVLTRARIALWIVGTESKLEQNSVWKRLIADTKARQLYTYCFPGYFNDTTTGSPSTPGGQSNSLQESSPISPPKLSLGAKKTKWDQKRRRSEDGIITEEESYQAGKWKLQNRENEPLAVSSNENNNSARGEPSSTNARPNISTNKKPDGANTDVPADPRLRGYSGSLVAKNPVDDGYKSLSPHQQQEQAPLPPPP
jgi:senataxin